jgi:hypothetical protein
MSSIIRLGDTFHGISGFGRGVFTNDVYGGRTYAGQCKDGYPYGLGVLTWPDGSKYYAEYGPDGQYDGRCLVRYDDGRNVYSLYERGRQTDRAVVSAKSSNGRRRRRLYNGVVCERNDPRLLALIAQVAPVEVRPTRPNAIIG